MGWLWDDGVKVVEKSAEMAWALGEIKDLNERLRKEQERPSMDLQGQFIAHLQAEVLYWRSQFVHERQRAEVAIDQCRSTHLGIGPVTLPPRPTEMPPVHEMSELFNNPELALMGQS